MHFPFVSGNHYPVAHPALWDCYHWLRSGLVSLGHTVTFAGDSDASAVNVFFEFFMNRTGERLRANTWRRDVTPAPTEVGFVPHLGDGAYGCSRVTLRHG
jgi:hypothetical protein